jgi:hypothetical protein
MPKDQWDFVPKDDELEEQREQLAPEVSAVHVNHGPARTPATDPGEADVLVGSDEEGLAQFFDDEEPESVSGRPEVADEEEDLEELLEEQHYSFPPEREE